MRCEYEANISFTLKWALKLYGVFIRWHCKQNRIYEFCLFLNVQQLRF